MHTYIIMLGIPKHLMSIGLWSFKLQYAKYRIPANRTPLLIRAPWGTFWAHNGHFWSKMSIVSSLQLMKFNRTPSFYLRRYCMWEFCIRISVLKGNFNIFNILQTKVMTKKQQSDFYREMFADSSLVWFTQYQSIVEVRWFLCSNFGYHSW